jgi:predicted ATPase
VTSVIGRTVPHRLLVEAAGLGEESMLAALNAASQAGLLVEEGGLEHRFTHDVIREVVEGDLGAGRRRALHHRVGEALEQLSGTAAELGRHFLEGRQPERALPYTELAGDQAEAVFAHEEAERHYRIRLPRW